MYDVTVHKSNDDKRLTYHISSKFTKLANGFCGVDA